RPYRHAFVAAGFVTVFHLQGQDIGGMERWSVTLLEPSGYCYATVAWFRISRGAIFKSRTTPACHSYDLKGNALHTTPPDPGEINLSIRPPGAEFQLLPSGTSVERLIGAHLQRIESSRDLVQFDARSLRRHTLELAQRVFDHMVTKGHYVRLSNEDVERLCRM